MTRLPTQALAALLLAAACTTERQVGRFLEPQSDDGGGPFADAVPLEDALGGGQPVDGAEVGGVVVDAGIETVPTVHFGRLSPKRALPDEAACAAMIQRGGAEARPDNTVYNNTISPSEQVAMLGAFGGGRGFDSAAIPFGKRVSGNFAGTTDEILRWGACKWGFDEDFVRAESYQVNAWHQASVSGWTSNRSNCPPSGGPTRNGPDGVECAQVFGIFGLTWQFNKSAWPMYRDSTAFHVDYTLAVQRVCFEGLVDYMKGWGPPEKQYGPNDEFGCAASFFTGGWYDYTTIQQLNRIKDTLAKQPWKSGI
jgi:hypothetical protein